MSRETLLAMDIKSGEKVAVCTSCNGDKKCKACDGGKKNQRCVCGVWDGIAGINRGKSVGICPTCEGTGTVT